MSFICSKLGFFFLPSQPKQPPNHFKMNKIWVDAVVWMLKAEAGEFMPLWTKKANSALNAADGIKRGHVGLGQGLWLKHILECRAARAHPTCRKPEGRAEEGAGFDTPEARRIPPGSWRPYFEEAGGQDKTLETEHFGFAANWSSSKKQTEIWNLAAAVWLSFCSVHLQKCTYVLPY